MKSRIGVASAIWAVALLLSRVVGLLRDSVLGHTLGVSPAADAYQAAFRIPDWFMLMMAGGTLSIVFIPIFTAHIERGDDARGWRTFSVVANFMLVVMLLLGPIMWVLVPALGHVLAPGFSAEQQALLVRLTRIILPAQAFHVIGGLLSAALLARDKHAVPALSPLLYSTGIIAGGLILGTAEGFAWGVFVGAFAGSFLVPLIAALRTGLSWQPVLSFADPDLRTYLARWFPVLLGGSLILVDDTLLARFGSDLDAGSVAVLGYAKTLMRAPMGIFGAAMAFASYPTLTRLYLEGKNADAFRLVTTSTRRVLVLALASQVALTVAAPEVGTLVYGTHRIAPARMAELGGCVAAFSLGLGAWSAQILMARAFYAQGKGWIPARVGLAAAIVCLPLYWVLGARFGAAGLAVASSATVTASVVALAWTLRRQGGAEEAGYVGFLLRALPATALAIAAGLAVRAFLPEPAWTRLDALIRAGVLGTAGGLAFLAAAWALRVPELDAALAPILRRLRRK